MKLSRDWLSDYVDLTGISDEDLGRRFTEIGHAVESVEKHGDDTVFDLEITTNRVDAMSHLGVGRELAAAFGGEIRSAPRFEGETTTAGSVKVRMAAPERCARFSGY